VFHRPHQQELVHLREGSRIRAAPPQIGHHLPQMVGAGLLTFPVAGQLAGIDPELGGHPGHRDRWGRAQFIGHEPQPGQGAQLDRHPQHRARSPLRPNERLIRPGQREVPDQPVPADLREPPQAPQLRVGKHITGRHPPSQGHHATALDHA